MGDGFEFKDIPSKLYVSGSNDDLLKMLKIELYNGTDPVADIPNSTITTIDTIPSNLAGNLSADADQPDYLGLTLPAGGNVIDIERVINSKKGVQLKYDISLQGGQPGTVTSAMLNAEITVELLIWLPLKFIANNDKGAMIKFPGMFEADKDLFGRSSQEDSMFNMMSRIRVEIGMNSDAFKDGIMEMVDNSYVIQCPLESKAIVLDLGMDDVGYINRNYPFSPEIGIWFGNGTGPTIPRGLGVMSLGFDADIKYKL
jgi:hypothetical protein